MILYIILVIVILFGAIPFALIEQLINSIIAGVNVIMAILAAVINGLIRLVLGIVYGIVNLSVGTLWNMLDGVIGTMGAYIPLSVADLALWNFTLPDVDFSLWIGNRLLSPIGTFLYMLIGDEFWSNIIGGVALGALAILVIMIGLKARR